jgi:exosortase K
MMAQAPRPATPARRAGRRSEPAPGPATKDAHAVLQASASAGQARAALLRALAALVTLAGGYLLKRMYSSAGADALSWVLTPSAAIAQLAGVALVHEPGAGFISREAHMVVGPACAGVNFLLASWLALYLCLQGGMRPERLVFVSAVCLGTAYLVTISMNGLRIALAAQLFSLDIYSAVWTKARVHRLLGVVLYSGALLGLCLLAERVRHGMVQPLRAARGLYTGLAVYLGVSLVIPILNRAFLRNPAHFAEHALLTLAGALGVALLLRLGLRLCSRSGPA